MKPVHFYGRFSTLEQSDGDSERRQESGYEKFLKSGKYGTGLQFLDRGKSAHKGNKQKALAELLAAIKSGRIAPGDILYVEHIDRLSRKGIRPTQDLINGILNSGIDIAINMPLSKVYFAKDKNDFGGAVELAAFAYAAYIYSAALSKRICDSWEDTRTQIRKGKKVPANSPAWVRWNKSKQKYDLANDEAAEAIRHIFKRTIDGLGAPSVLAELQADFKPLGRSSWNETYVRNILNGRQVLGEHQPGKLAESGKLIPEGKPIPGYFPKIIDEKTWLAAQQATANRKKETGPSKDWVNLFTGIVHHALDNCPAHVYTYQQTRADGRKVTIRRLKSYKADKREKGASYETVCLIQFETAVLSFLKEIDVRQFGKPVNDGKELQAAKGALAKKQKRIAELQKELKDDSQSIELVLPVLKELQTEATELKQKIQSLAVESDRQPAVDAAKVKALLDLPETNENRQLLREAIKRVVKRISICPMKLDGKRRCDRVVTEIEIEFFAGHRRTISLCNGNIIVLDQKSPASPPMAERPNVREWAQNTLLPSLRKMFLVFQNDDLTVPAYGRALAKPR